MLTTRSKLAAHVEERLLQRNQIIENYFASDALRLANACREMSERFLKGGRLLAFGRGPYATDAQHGSCTRAGAGDRRQVQSVSYRAQ